MNVFIQDLSIDLVRATTQPLRDIEENTAEELAKSIRASGLLQPIMVRPVDSEYEVVFGNHRLEACKNLGWKTIPAFVRELSSEESFLIRVVENLQRNVEINPLIEAKGYIELIGKGWTINQIAGRIGKSDSYVSDRVGLIRRLHPTIAKNYENGGDRYLKPSHLELLARESKDRQLRLSIIMSKKHLSVRNLEKLISGDEPVSETLKAMGDSLYVRMPHKVVDCMRLKEGDTVFFCVEGHNRVAIQTAKTVTADHSENLIDPQTSVA